MVESDDNDGLKRWKIIWKRERKKERQRKYEKEIIF